LCPSIKTTPKAKLAQSSDDKGAQMMAIRHSNNPEYVPLPKATFIEGGVLTGWEDVTPDEVLCYNLASNASCSPNPPGAPTPSGLSHTPVLVTDIGDSSDDNWGWELVINNSKVVVNKGHHTNSVCKNINSGFQEIQNHFQKISAKTGHSLMTLHAEFYNHHSASSLQSD
ncbi:hypothetical protein H0H87_002362, partial [Tephrocybe sp. NHM501043]